MVMSDSKIILNLPAAASHTHKPGEVPSAGYVQSSSKGRCANKGQTGSNYKNNIIVIVTVNMCEIFIMS